SAASVDPHRSARGRGIRRRRLSPSSRPERRSPGNRRRSPLECCAGSRPCVFFVPVTIHSDSPIGDLSRLRIDRDAPPRRRWLPVAILVVLGAAGAAVYPSARSYVAERRAPEVEIAHATQVIASPGGSTALPVLVATGYVVARHSSDVGVKAGGRIAVLRFEEG